MEELKSQPIRFSFEADILRKATGEPITDAKDLDYENMFIEGIASDDSKDMQNDRLDPSKFDMSYFMQAGKINDNHTKTIVGEPREFKITPDNKLYLKAYLYSTSKEAKEIYKNAWVMQSDPNSTRRYSWSIEANAVRDPIDKNKVLALIATGCALTTTPINFRHTYAQIVKSMTGQKNTVFETESELTEAGTELLKSFGMTSDELVNYLAKNRLNLLELYELKQIEKAIPELGFSKSIAYVATANKFPNTNLYYLTKALKSNIVSKETVYFTICEHVANKVWDKERVEILYKGIEGGEITPEPESKMITRESTHSQIRENLAGNTGKRVKKLIKKYPKSKVFEQIALGFETEKEHGGTIADQLNTAIDHLEEDIEYYSNSKPKNWAKKELIEKSFLEDCIS